jgi:hypothetical protein
MHIPLPLIFVSALLPACASKPADAPSATPEAAEPGTRVSLEAARATALAKIPGTVVEGELERENGRLVYSFEIQPSAPNSRLKEVHVDANDGSIVAVEDEAEDDDRDGEDEKDDDDKDDDKK